MKGALTAGVEAGVAAVPVRLFAVAVASTDERETPHSRVHSGSSAGKTLLICSQCQTPL